MLFAISKPKIFLNNLTGNPPARVILGQVFEIVCFHKILHFLFGLINELKVQYALAKEVSQSIVNCQQAEEDMGSIIRKIPQGVIILNTTTNKVTLMNKAA